MSSEPVSAVVIAGGRSRRLGFDKRRLRLWGDAGPTLLEHTVALVRSLCDEVVVVLNDPEQWPELPARIVPDAFPAAGALGGLATGLAAASHAYTLAVASDMPLLNPNLLRAMLAQPRDYDALVAQVVAAERDSQPRRQGAADPQQTPAARTRNALSVEPLHAIYSRACLAPMQEQIAAGHYQIVGFFAHVQVRYLDPALLSTYDPQEHSFLSVNTPEQLEQIRQLLSSAGNS